MCSLKLPQTHAIKHKPAVTVLDTGRGDNVRLNLSNQPPLAPVAGDTPLCRGCTPSTTGLASRLRQRQVDLPTALIYSTQPSLSAHRCFISL